MSRLVAWMVGLAAVAGCGHLGPAAHPLYAGPARATAEVATLSGPVAAVDGVDVSHLGNFFSLLPGCHVVTLRSKIGEGGVGGAWSTEIRDRVYVFDMKPGHGYRIDVRLLRGDQSVGSANVSGVELKASELDVRGKRVRTVQPTRRSQEIEACRASAEPAESEPEAKVEPTAPAGPAAPADPPTAESK